MAMERITEPGLTIPVMPQYKAIMFTNKSYTAILQKMLSRGNSLQEEPQKKDGVLSVDSETHPYVHSPQVLICNAFYLGTKNSASNRIKDADYRIKIGIAAQLNLGVRFLDFEITTLERKLWVICDGKLAMHGSELFTILKGFVDKQKEANNILKEKIILNFRERESCMEYLLPTWELLSQFIINFFEPNKIGNPYFVTGLHRGEILQNMVGVFVLLAPDDLNIALDAHSHLNWGSNSVVKVKPKFNGANDCILQWANLQEARKYDDFPEFCRKLVWLDISDPGYKGTASHEIQSMLDGKILYPDKKPRFNIISFGSLNSTDVNKFLNNVPNQNLESV